MSTEMAVAPALSRAGVENLSRARQEPAWLLDLRLRAFDRFSALPVPDQRTEGWRRTSLRGLDLAGLHIEPSLAPAEPSAAPDGVSVLDLSDALRNAALEPLLREHFSRIAPMEDEKFTALHYAFFNAATLVYVRRNVQVEQPLWLTHRFGSTAALAHTLVVLEEGAQLALVEDYAGGGAFASSVVEQVVGQNAYLRYVHLQRLAGEAWNFSTQRATLARDASLRTLNVALGSRMSRNTVQVALDGRASQADLLGIVQGNERQHVDFQTLQDHSGDATRSDLVIHDALRDRASANFTGLIRINKSARQTESSQEQKNILLSDHARADSDPKLEILNNDVIRCTHGAAVGPVDEELVFYLESRGLARAEAEALIVEGFFRSVLDKLHAPALQDAVWAALNP